MDSPTRMVSIVAWAVFWVESSATLPLPVIMGVPPISMVTTTSQMAARYRRREGSQLQVLLIFSSFDQDRDGFDC